MLLGAALGGTTIAMLSGLNQFEMAGDEARAACAAAAAAARPPEPCARAHLRRRAADGYPARASTRSASMPNSSSSG